LKERDPTADSEVCSEKERHNEGLWEGVQEAGRKREQRDELKKDDVEPEENSVVASDGVVHDVMTDPEESQAYKGD